MLFVTTLSEYTREKSPRRAQGGPVGPPGDPVGPFGEPVLPHEGPVVPPDKSREEVFTQEVQQDHPGHKFT